MIFSLQIMFRRNLFNVIYLISLQSDPSILVVGFQLFTELLQSTRVSLVVEFGATEGQMA